MPDNNPEILDEIVFSARLQEYYDAFTSIISRQSMTESDQSKLCYILALKQFNCRVRIIDPNTGKETIVKI